MLEKTKKLNSLFAQWPRYETDSNFISDGIVDEAVWVMTIPKILFIMKEPNDPNGTEDFDLREFLSVGAVGDDGKSYSPTWGMTARWTKGLTEGFLSWNETNNFDFTSPQIRMEYLKRIAVFNLKKSGGAGSTVVGSLAERATRHRDTIKQEIEIIQPEIIVCCGTGPEIYWHVFDEEEFDWQKKPSNGVTTSRNRKGGWLLVDYFHPQARYPHNFLYVMLIEAIKEVFRD